MEKRYLITALLFSMVVANSAFGMMTGLKRGGYRALQQTTTRAEQKFIPRTYSTTPPKTTFTAPAIAKGGFWNNFMNYFKRPEWTKNFWKRLTSMSPMKKAAIGGGAVYGGLLTKYAINKAALEETSYDIDKKERDKNNRMLIGDYPRTEYSINNFPTYYTVKNPSLVVYETPEDYSRAYGRYGLAMLNAGDLGNNPSYFALGLKGLLDANVASVEISYYGAYAVDRKATDLMYIAYIGDVEVSVSDPLLGKIPRFFVKDTDAYDKLMQQLNDIQYETPKNPLAEYNEKKQQEITDAAQKYKVKAHVVGSIGKQRELTLYYTPIYSNPIKPEQKKLASLFLDGYGRVQVKYEVPESEWKIRKTDLEPIIETTKNAMLTSKSVTASSEFVNDLQKSK